MTDVLSFAEAFSIAAGLMMACVAGLLWHHHAMRPAWGLRWVAVAMGLGATTNLLAPVFITASRLAGSATALGLLTMMIGYGSLAALMVGVRHYVLTPPQRPWRFFVLLWLSAQATVLTTAIAFGWTWVGDLIASSVFVYGAILTLKASRREPDVGHRLLAMTFLLHPLSVICLALAGLDVRAARYVVALPYTVVGLVLLSTSLVRLRSELMRELEARSRAEAALDRSHAVQHALLQLAPVPMAFTPVVDGKVPRSFWNQAWYRCFGHQPGSKEGLGGSDFDFYIEPRARETYMSKVLAQGQVGPFEIYLRHASGSSMLCVMQGCVIESDDGPFVVSTFIDITAQRANELHLKEFEAMVQNADDGILVLERGLFAAVNPAVERMFGAPASALVGSSPVDWSPAQQDDGRSSTDAALAMVGAALTGQAQRFDWLHRRSNGEIFSAQVTLTPVEGIEGRLVAVVRDVTEDRAKALALARSEARFKSIISVSNTGAWEFHGGSNYLWCSPEYFTMLGRDPADYPMEGLANLQTTWVDLLHPDDAQASGQRFADYLAAGSVGMYESVFRMRHADGNWVWIWSRGQTLRNADGSPSDVTVGTHINITERKEAEGRMAELNQTLEARVQERTWELTQALNDLNRTQQDLIQSEKLAALGGLVAGVAHELNTPIGNAVTVASTLSDAEGSMREKLVTGLTRAALNEFLDTVGEASGMLNRNLARAAGLVSSFKQVAVDQNNHQRRPFELEEMLSEVQIVMAPSLRKAHVALQLDLRENLKLDSFPGALTQVLMILINNAVTHAFEGRTDGTVTLTAGATQNHDRALIVVADDGVGIEPDSLGRIFEPFFTTKLGKGGSGLGLHIGYNLVTGTLGGRISAESQPGQGTRVIVELPLAAPQSSTLPAAKAS